MRHRVLAVLVFASVTIVGSPQESVTKETIDGWMAELSNWGRWGDEDQRGSVNLITPGKRIAAAALVTEGFSVSLARVVEKEPAPDNPRPFGHKMLKTGESGGQFVADEYSVEYHGLAHTHFDTLAHMSFEGKSYNGFEMAEVNEQGAPHLAVTNYKDGIFTKGVLIDIPYLKGVDWLEPGRRSIPLTSMHGRRCLASKSKQETSFSSIPDAGSAATRKEPGDAARVGRGSMPRPRNGSMIATSP